jgi:hypothetical protein
MQNRRITHLLGARCAAQTEISGGRCFPAASFIRDSTLLKVWYSTVILELFVMSCVCVCSLLIQLLLFLDARWKKIVVAQGVDEREPDHIRLVRGLVDILGHRRKV